MGISRWISDISSIKWWQSMGLTRPASYFQTTQTLKCDSKSKSRTVTYRQIGFRAVCHMLNMSAGSHCSKEIKGNESANINCAIWHHQPPNNEGLFNWTQQKPWRSKGCFLVRRRWWFQDLLDSSKHSQSSILSEKRNHLPCKDSLTHVQATIFVAQMIHFLYCLPRDCHYLTTFCNLIGPNTISDQGPRSLSIQWSQRTAWCQ